MHRHKKHLFFDLDDTVTLSRSPIDADMAELLPSLGRDIIIISGAHSSQIKKQVNDLPLYVLGQNGNEAYTPTGDLLWEERLSEDHARIIHEHVDAIKKLCTFDVANHDDLIEHRGAQISYSLIGHHEEVSRKKAFDPDRTKRLELLTTVPFDSEHVEVKIGGTTCFDYFMKGKHKGYNVQRLINAQGWDIADSVYFGDALVPGGNDESVIGVIDTVSVRDHRHTYELLHEYFILPV